MTLPILSTKLFVPAPRPHLVVRQRLLERLEAGLANQITLISAIGPAGHGIPSANIEIAGGWEAIHTVADVGGGTGAMLAEILRAHPHLRGILVDLPATVARSAEIFPAAGVADRVTTAGQSFYDPILFRADLYLLRRVINDWPDRESEIILRNYAQAAQPDGRVVILKSVHPDGAPKDLVIEMVLLGGKPRTVSEFTALARRAGLEVASAGKQADYFVVECRPVAPGGPAT